MPGQFLGTLAGVMAALALFTFGLLKLADLWRSRARAWEQAAVAAGWACLAFGVTLVISTAYYAVSS
ncbi:MULTISPECIES: hypothetical protein [Amycolatopsis]|uniref:Uncharacterized protein n=1 Tax=Amycolatopsis thermalba TaxID=944492 RepID=A0ABY4NXP5_9PSEU|nr:MULTISPECIES: hypothetical protein [Amycolatopsis]OXM74999.1 hypothetical protein CF166_03195 [Amycolatopsis sp. KNN50.9b]UQS24816.1 hypothetical protein L1857_19345 [Amycolatopsis thermalba]